MRIRPLSRTIHWGFYGTSLQYGEAPWLRGAFDEEGWILADLTFLLVL